MIQRLVELADPISIILLENKKGPPMLTQVEIYPAKEILQILKPFKSANAEKISSLPVK